MPANIPTPIRIPPMPKHDADGLEQYYDYDVRDDSEIKKELKYKRRDKISTVALYIAATSFVSGLIAKIISGCLNSKPFAIIGSVLFATMIISVFIGMFFNDDI